MKRTQAADLKALPLAKDLERVLTLMPAGELISAGSSRNLVAEAETHLHSPPAPSLMHKPPSYHNDMYPDHSTPAHPASSSSSRRVRLEDLLDTTRRLAAAWERSRAPLLENRHLEKELADMLVMTRSRMEAELLVGGDGGVGC